MKPRTSVYARILWLFSFVVLTPLLLAAVAQLSALAQSGRGFPAPPSKPTASPEAVSPNRNEAKRSSVIDRNGNTYKLVFPTRPGLDNFVEQLNKAGDEGYYLRSAAYHWQRKSASTKTAYAFPVAILKLDEVQHEYAYFETSGKPARVITDFEQKYGDLAKRGFRLVAHLLLGKSCDDNGCESYDYLFLLGREKSVEKPTQFTLARSNRHLTSKTITAKLAAQIKEKLTDGFYPSDLLSEPEPTIVLTPTKNAEESSDGSGDVQVVLFCSADTRSRMIGHLAKQGYRLDLIDTQSALMYRQVQAIAPFTYTWLEVGDKGFDEKLAKLQTSGAIYRMASPDDWGVKDQLVFEQGVDDNHQRAEYRVLQLEFQVIESGAVPRRSVPNADVHIDLTSESKQKLQLLDRLAREGFQVRDLFVSDTPSDKVGVLLERTR
jgi:hypothetical protein